MSKATRSAAESTEDVAISKVRVMARLFMECGQVWSDSSSLWCRTAERESDAGAFHAGEIDPRGAAGERWSAEAEINANLRRRIGGQCLVGDENRRGLER